MKTLRSDRSATVPTAPGSASTPQDLENSLTILGAHMAIAAERAALPAVEVLNVKRSFGKICAVDGLTLTIQAGTVVGIVGPNGAGKTTLIDMICGLVRPSSGSVRVLGEDVVRGGAQLRARIGVLPQETALYEEVTAQQNLNFAASLYGVPQAEARIAEVLDLVGLGQRANDFVRGFSGGMQRRLAIARALLHNPSLLILDEPTVGVDLEARHQIWAHIRSLKALGRTVILTTNYLDEAEALCDRVAILRSGKLLAEDTPAAFTARTGRCLELECPEAGATLLKEALLSHPDIMRVESADFGLRTYLKAGVNPEDLVHFARGFYPVRGFRTRPPDLAEVFRSLTAEDAQS